ncbi:MAG: RibD family protein [Akkermansiaceae bacterium]|nr:RibD family protein [Akkermansiaceae bacterium]
MLRPRISTNLAVSADGKITSVAGVASGWTSAMDHTRLLELRESADAILVGRGTLEADRMTLTVPGEARQPLRCIVSRSGELDSAHPIFSKEGGAIHLLVTGELRGEIDPRVTVHRSTLREFLRTLVVNEGVEQLHCEGGGQLIRELAELDVIDEFHVTLAGHTVFGGQLARTATGIPSEYLPSALEFQISRFDARPELGECFVSYTRRR